MAVADGPIFARVTLTYRGTGPVVSVGFGSREIAPWLIRPAEADRGHVPPGDPETTGRRHRASPSRMQPGQSFVEYVSLRVYAEVLTTGRHDIVIDWPVYALKPSDPVVTATRDQIVSARFPVTVLTRPDGTRDLAFGGSDRIEPEPRLRFRTTLTVDVKPRTDKTIRDLCRELTERYDRERRFPTADTQLVDEVVRDDADPAFDGLRARLLSDEVFGSDPGRLVELLVQNSAADPRRADVAVAHLDAESVLAVAAVLREKSLPPYLLAALKGRVLGAKSVWTRAMFLARYPAECPTRWRERLARELSTCDTLSAADLADRVRALDSDRYPTRQAARRDLLALGPRVIRPLSEMLRGGSLSAEQGAAVEGVIAETRARYPVGGPRTVKWPGLYEGGRHAFVGVDIPDALRPVRTALDQICAAPDLAGAVEVLEALARNGSDSLVGVEAAYLLNRLRRQ